MSDDRSTITIPSGSYAAILDAVQRAIVDKCASNATRKAAFSALLALIEAGALVGDTPISSPARDERGATAARTKTRHWADFSDALLARPNHPIHATSAEDNRLGDDRRAIQTRRTAER
jgi:hypothetical protein